jgi:hypothetical protein
MKIQTKKSFYRVLWQNFWQIYLSTVKIFNLMRKFNGIFIKAANIDK